MTLHEVSCAVCDKPVPAASDGTQWRVHYGACRVEAEKRVKHELRESSEAVGLEQERRRLLTLLDDVRQAKWHMEQRLRSVLRPVDWELTDGELDILARKMERE